MSLRINLLRVLGIVTLLGGALVAQGQTPLTPAESPSPLPVTFEMLLERLTVEPKDKDDEKEVEAQKVENEKQAIVMLALAPYVFQPTDEQLKELEKAGASERLIKALKRVTADVLEPDASGVSPIDRLLIQQLGDKNVVVRAKAAIALGKRKVAAAIPQLAAVVASDNWNTGAYLPGSDSQREFYLFTDASKIHSLAVLLELDRKAAERALMKAAESPESKVSSWATDILTRLAEPPPTFDPFAEPAPRANP